MNYRGTGLSTYLNFSYKPTRAMSTNVILEFKSVLLPLKMFCFVFRFQFDFINMYLFMQSRRFKFTLFGGARYSKRILCTLLSKRPVRFRTCIEISDAPVRSGRVQFRKQLSSISRYSRVQNTQPYYHIIIQFRLDRPANHLRAHL